MAKKFRPPASPLYSDMNFYDEAYPVVRGEWRECLNCGARVHVATKHFPAYCLKPECRKMAPQGAGLMPVTERSLYLCKNGDWGDHAEK